VRKITKDEKNLIERWVREGKVRDIRPSGFWRHRLKNIPIYTPPSHDSIPEPIPGLLEINDHPIFHMRADIPTIDDYFKPEVKYYRKEWNVPEHIQGDTISQIRSMIDHLPIHDGCNQIKDVCQFKGNLLISPWARGFLTQLVDDYVRRGQ